MNYTLLIGAALTVELEGIEAALKVASPFTMIHTRVELLKRRDVAEKELLQVLFKYRQETR